MDSNNPQTSPQPAPVQPVQPAQPAAPQPVEEGSKKMGVWLIGGVVLILLIVGGIYLYMSRQQAKQSLQTETPPAATTAPQDNLENDLESVNVESPVDSEFTSVDQDLQNL